MEFLNKNNNIFFTFLGFTTLFILGGCIQNKPASISLEDSELAVPVINSVAALGQLSPYGEIRRLAPPVSGFGGTPRILKLLVDVGEDVKQGQILAVFDNQPKIIADILALEAKIETLEAKIAIQKREILRYQIAADEGATTLILLDDEKNQLVKLNGQKKESLAEMIGLKADFSDSELKSPIDGMVLRINFREGERPDIDGVIEVGANQTMEALIEVYESDISRIQLGQAVTLISENGGFNGSINGVVKTISPQIRQRKVLSTDPTGDADARIVEVRVSIDPEFYSLVKNFTGMKVIARFNLP